MFRVLVSTLILGLAALPPAANAVTIVQCQDAEGDRTFQATCPPGTEVVETRKIYTGPKDKQADLSELKTEHPVVLYRVPGCEACDLVSYYLKARGIPYEEKNVSDNAKLQEELTAKTGALSVPVVSIGEEIVEGYNKPALKQKLDETGYPDSTADAAPGTAETSAN